MTLYKANFADSLNNSEWIFKPVSFREFIFVINFLANESDEEELDRELRIKALLAGEVVCTNLSAYKLSHVVWLDAGAHEALAPQV